MNHFNTKLWVGVGFLALVFLLLVGNLASGQTVVRDRETVLLNGFLNCERGAASDAGRTCPFRLHYVQLEAGRTYLIRMESSDFGAHLVLENMAGKTLADDHDLWDLLNGTILFRPTETARYRLIASAVAPREGFYEITIREPFEVANIEAALIEDESSPANGELSYDVPLVAGRRYIIDVSSIDFDAYVKLLNSDEAIVAFANECDRLGTARIAFAPTESAVYRIVASSQAAGATGAFRLVVCEE